MKSLKDPGLHLHYRCTQFTSSVWSTCYFCVELKQKLSLTREYGWKIILQVFLLSTSHSQGWHLTTADFPRPAILSTSFRLFYLVTTLKHLDIAAVCICPLSREISGSKLCLRHTVSYIASNLNPYLKFSRKNTPSYKSWIWYFHNIW